MNHSVRRLSVCSARASSRAACTPLLQTPRALPHPPSGATAAPSATTSRVDASACPDARGDTTHPSAPSPRGTAQTWSRRSGLWPPRLARPAPLVSAPLSVPRPAAPADLDAVGDAVREAPRRCSAPRHRARLAVPCPPAVLLRPAASPRAHPRLPASAPQPLDPSPAALTDAAPPLAGLCGLSVPVHPLASAPARVDTIRITSARVASNHVRVRNFADRYEAVLGILLGEEAPLHAVLELPRDAAALLAAVEDSLGPPPTARPRPPPPAAFSPAELAGLEQALRGASLARFLRRRPVYRLAR